MLLAVLLLSSLVVSLTGTSGNAIGHIVIHHSLYKKSCHALATLANNLIS